MNKIDRILEQTACQCLKDSALIVNIRAICRGEEPPHKVNRGSRICDVHPLDDRGETDD